MKLPLSNKFRCLSHAVPLAGALNQNSHVSSTNPMKRSNLIVCCVIVIVALAQSSYANLIVNGVNNGTFSSTATMEYNSTATDPTTVTQSQPEIGFGSSPGSPASLTMTNGTLTITASQWNSFVGRQSDSGVTVGKGNGILTVLGGSLTWNATQSGNAQFAVGNANASGTINVSGGTLFLNTGDFDIGRDTSGIGTVNLTGGTLVSDATTFTMGTEVTTNSVTSGIVNFGDGNGVFALTNVTTISIGTLGQTDYFNFVGASGGTLEINQYSQSQFQSLVAAGSIRVNNSTTSMASFQYSTNSTLGVGVLQLASLLVTTPTVSPTNMVYAGTPVTLSDLPSGGTTFQWQTDNGTGGATFSDIVGATGTNYALNTSSLLGTYQYEFVATSGSLSVTSAPTSLIVVAATAPLFATNTASPNTTTNYVGGTQTYSASFIGTLPIDYQWQFSPDGQESDAVSISDATNTTLILANLALTNSGYYSLEAYNNVSPFTTNSPWTSLTVIADTNEFITWSTPVIFSGLTAGQILTNAPGSYLEGAFFGSAAGPFPVSVNGEIFTFTGDGSSASVVGNQGVSSGAWLVGTNTTGNANFDAVLNQFAYDSVGTTHTITLHNLVVGQEYSVQLFALDDRSLSPSVNVRPCDFQATNDPADVSATYTMGTNAYVIGTFTAPTTDVAVQQNLLSSSGGGIASGNINAVVVRALSYTPSAQPAIITPPSSLIAYAGRTVQFSAIASGIPSPTYQWQISTDGGNTFSNLVNGGGVSGATNTTLLITNVTLADSGAEYEIIATNSAGFATSMAADLTVIAAPPLSGPYSTNVLTLKPVAYWPLNETLLDPYNNGNGGTPAYDASANQHDGQYLYLCENGFDGIVGPQPSEGYPQFAIGQGALQPTTGYSNAWAITPALNLNTNTVTIAMWLNPNGEQGDYTGLYMDRNTGDEEGMNYSSGQRLGYTWNDNDSGTWSYVSGPVIPTNIWSFVALVVTPSNASFYVINTNGVSSTTYSYNHTNAVWGGEVTPDPLIRIGSDNAWQTRTFNGAIDEVAIFNYALSAGQLVGLTGMSTVNTSAATASFTGTVSGGVGSQMLNFSWAPDHLGWKLYTNSVGLTAASSWFPVSGSAAVTNESISINPAQTNVFFQLRYP